MMRFSLTGVVGSTFLVCLFVAVVASEGYGFVIYSETDQGDLPSDPNLAPVVPLLPGPNEIIGRVGGSDGGDFLKFEVPAGPFGVERFEYSLLPDPDPNQAVGEVLILVHQAVAGPTGPSDVTEWYYGVLPASGDLFLDVPKSGPLISALVPGVHGIQFLADVDPSYHMTLFLQIVPEPSACVLFVGLTLMGMFSRRMKRR